MFIALAVLIAVLLVSGQALWKSALSANQQFEVSVGYLFSFDFLRFLFSLKILLGFGVYAVGTLLYFSALKNYDYHQVQLVILPVSLIGSIIIASALFGEKLSMLNILGVAVLLLGITLAVWK